MASHSRKNTRVITTGNLQRARQYKRYTWFIPVIIALYVIVRNITMWPKAIMSDPSPLTLLGIIVFIVLVTFILSILPVFIARGALDIYTQRLIENSRFVTVQDFSYWREKLKGTSPAMMSFLADLQLEPEKDRIASLMYYEHLGILTELPQGTYQLTDSAATINSLLPHEQYFLQHLVTSKGTAAEQKQWSDLVTQDAKKLGYITDRVIPTKRSQMTKEEKRKDTLGTIIGVLILAGVIFWLFNWNSRSEGLMAMLDAAPEGLSLGQQLEYLNQAPGIWPQLAEMLALYMVLFGVILYPIGVALGGYLTRNLIKPFKRTFKGNQQSELVYGMRNFIHDFTNLSTADKRAVIVWDEYVIYAVTLEENTEIVKQIRQLHAQVAQ